MKRLLSVLAFLIGIVTYGQTALSNTGSIRIHEKGQIGFHTHFINNAPFDENLGLAGFYGQEQLVLSGALTPIFFDTEIDIDNGLLLNTSLGVINNVNFIAGDVITPKNLDDIYLNFFRDAFYVGEANGSKTDGYVQITNIQDFIFPVGDTDQLRPLTLNSEAVNSTAKCAYFFENPNEPSSLDNSFSTVIRQESLEAIHTVEFWRLEGSERSTITINWNERSNLNALTDTFNTVTVVGWNKSANQWVSIGNTVRAGNFNQGFITSETFVPDDFEIITLGALASPAEVITLDNYLLTPNGDGLNDVLVIPEMQLSPNNSIKIYDRFGLKVFDLINYTNEFDGKSNVNNLVIEKDLGLPEGVYFYVIKLDDLALDYQGFLYLVR